MKKSIFTIVLSVLLSVAGIASTNPIKKVTINTDAAVTMSIDITNADLFETAEFDADRNNLVFETNASISFIQIFNQDGELEFQLPVMSNKVTISQSIMGDGEYKLGFMIEGLTDIQFMDISAK